MLSMKEIPSPTGNAKWTRAAVDKLLSNHKYLPLVSLEIYTAAQYEKAARSNVDYGKADLPRKEIRYISPKLGSI